MEHIEVEVRFDWDEVVEARVAALSTRPVCETVFVDVYFDGPGHSLTLQNVWLRRRADAWELKLPNASDPGSYTEVVDETRIREALESRLGVAPFVELDLAEALSAAEVRPFAEIRTRRRSYVLDGESRSVHADLDLEETTGLRVGELELQLPREATGVEVLEARDVLERLASREGWQVRRRGGNKLLHYLQRHDVAHYEALVKMIKGGSTS